MYTMELYAACIGTQSSDEEKLKAALLGLIVEQSRFDGQPAQADGARLGKQVNVVLEAFKDAATLYPSE